jgi:hypothetical protein
MSPSNDRAFDPLFVRAIAWRMLFACEAGVLTPDQAGEALGLSANDFDWFRAVALRRVREAAAARVTA